MSQKPTLGRTVHYRLSRQDSEAINRRRSDGRNSLEYHRANADGGMIHTGTDVTPGDVFPMIITRVWNDGPDGEVNGQVLLDGNDTLWVTSVKQGDEQGCWMWPERV